MVEENNVNKINELVNSGINHFNNCHATVRKNYDQTINFQVLSISYNNKILSIKFIEDNNNENIEETIEIKNMRIIKIFGYEYNKKMNEKIFYTGRSHINLVPTVLRICGLVRFENNKNTDCEEVKFLSEQNLINEFKCIMCHCKYCKKCNYHLNHQKDHKDHENTKQEIITLKSKKELIDELLIKTLKHFNEFHNKKEQINYSKFEYNESSKDEIIIEVKYQEIHEFIHILNRKIIKIYDNLNIEHDKSQIYCLLTMLRYSGIVCFGDNIECKEVSDKYLENINGKYNCLGCHERKCFSCSKLKKTISKNPKITNILKSTNNNYLF